MLLLAFREYLLMPPLLLMLDITSHWIVETASFHWGTIPNGNCKKGLTLNKLFPLPFYTYLMKGSRVSCTGKEQHVIGSYYPLDSIVLGNLLWASLWTFEANLLYEWMKIWWLPIGRPSLRDKFPMDSLKSEPFYWKGLVYTYNICIEFFNLFEKC